jgi:hypothetical protein
MFEDGAYTTKDVATAIKRTKHVTERKLLAATKTLLIVFSPPAAVPPDVRKGFAFPEVCLSNLREA